MRAGALSTAAHRPAWGSGTWRAPGAARLALPCTAARPPQRRAALRVSAMGRVQMPDHGRPVAGAFEDAIKEDARRYRRTVRRRQGEMA